MASLSPSFVTYGRICHHSVRMPSPVGHALAGLAIAWSLDHRETRFDVTPGGLRSLSGSGHPRPQMIAWTCAALAAAPDLDLLGPWPHRAATHSVLAIALVAIVSMLVTAKVTGRVDWRIVLLFTTAYGSHLLLDWSSEDTRLPRGVQLLWPFSQRWFISDWQFFRSTIRERIFSLSSIRINLLAVVQEIAILGPIAALAWSVRVKTAARFPAKLSRGHHPAQ
jgi:LexA-binding, inner membrane-associated putative hydrolase